MWRLHHTRKTLCSSFMRGQKGHRNLNLWQVTSQPWRLSSNIVCSTAERLANGTRVRGHHNVRRTQVSAALATLRRNFRSVGDPPFPQNKEFNFKCLWNQQKPQAPLMAAHLALWNGSVEMSTLESKAHCSRLLYWKRDTLSRQLSVADKKTRTMADGVCGFEGSQSASVQKTGAFFFVTEKEMRERKKSVATVNLKNLLWPNILHTHILNIICMGPIPHYLPHSVCGTFA